MTFRRGRVPLAAPATLLALVLAGFASPALASAAQGQMEDCGLSFLAPSPRNCVRIDTHIGFGPCAPQGSGYQCQVQVESNVTFYDWTMPGEANVTLIGSCAGTATTAWGIHDDRVEIACGHSAFYAAGQCRAEQGRIAIDYTTEGQSLDVGLTDSIQMYPTDVFTVWMNACAPR